MLRLLGIRARLVLAQLVAVALGFAAAARFVPTEGLAASWAWFAGAAVASFAVALLVARSVTRPLAVLDEQVRNRGEGRRDAVLRDRGHDEVARLSGVINDYLLSVDEGLLALEKTQVEAVQAKARAEEEVAGRTADVTMLLQVAELLQGDADFAGAAGRVLRAVNDHLGLGWSSVSLLDEATSSLHLVASEGLDAELTQLLRLEGERPLQFRPGEGISGLAIATGTTQVANEGCRDTRFKLFERFSAHHKRIECLAAVPLRVDDATVGLLMAFNAAPPDRFSGARLALLERVAGLLAQLLRQRADFEDRFRETLTGLFRKDYWSQRLRAELQRVGRSREALGMVRMELCFTGEAEADPARRSDALARVGQVVRENLRGTDCAARSGYAVHVLLPNTDSLGTMFLAGRIKDRADALAFEEGEGRPLFETRVGVAAFPDDVADPAGLEGAVDEALAQAGRSGDGRLVCFGRAGDLASKGAP